MKIKKITAAVFILLLSIVSAHAKQPEWTTRLPFTKDAFWGVGTGKTKAEAVNGAKREILMQLSSRVEAVLTMKKKSGGGKLQAAEKLEMFLGNNSLRGAELEDTHEENGRYWVLMKYRDECGQILMNTALTRFEEEFEYETEEIMEEIVSGKVSEALMVERRLRELALENYRSEDIGVVLSGKNVIIRVINFLPFETELTPSQREGLVRLSETLFQELQKLNYRRLEIAGHANPMGIEDEGKELADLSRNRAETLASYMKQAGIHVDSVRWEGGDNTIGDVKTPEGRGKNRRVEIIVGFE